MNLETLKQFTKSQLYRIAPKLATAWFSARGRAHSHRVIKSWGAQEVNEAIISRYGRAVLSGPCQGTILTPLTEAEFLGPYLLGSYEAELHAWFEECLARPFEAIVDIGAKFGYYAIGMARRMPNAKCIAFDTDSWARNALREMCAANKTTNVEIRSYCDRNWIENSLPEHSLILSDCEGFERVLFSAMCRRLESATIIIEVHDHIVPGTNAKLRDAFSKTHRIEDMPSGMTRKSPVDISFLDARQQGLAINEVRPIQNWLLLTPL